MSRFYSTVKCKVGQLNLWILFFQTLELLRVQIKILKVMTDDSLNGELFDNLMNNLINTLPMRDLVITLLYFIPWKKSMLPKKVLNKNIGFESVKSISDLFVGAFQCAVARAESCTGKAIHVSPMPLMTTSGLYLNLTK